MLNISQKVMIKQYNIPSQHVQLSHHKVGKGSRCRSKEIILVSEKSSLCIEIFESS